MKKIYIKHNNRNLNNNNYYNIFFIIIVVKISISYKKMF